MASIYLSKTTFQKQDKYEKIIEVDKSIWLGENKFDVELLIKKEFSEYFTRREVIPNQICTKNIDNTITINVSVTNYNEILPTIRYWLPAILDIKPDALKSQIIDDFTQFKDLIKSSSIKR